MRREEARENRGKVFAVEIEKLDVEHQNVEMRRLAQEQLVDDRSAEHLHFMHVPERPTRVEEDFNSLIIELHVQSWRRRNSFQKIEVDEELLQTRRLLHCSEKDFGTNDEYAGVFRRGKYVGNVPELLVVEVLTDFELLQSPHHAHHEFPKSVLFLIQQGLQKQRNFVIFEEK